MMGFIETIENAIHDFFPYEYHDIAISMLAPFGIGQRAFWVTRQVFFADLNDDGIYEIIVGTRIVGNFINHFVHVLDVRNQKVHEMLVPPDDMFESNNIASYPYVWFVNGELIAFWNQWGYVAVGNLTIVDDELVFTRRAEPIPLFYHGTQRLRSGTYIVHDTVELRASLQIHGDVTIILTDGSHLDVSNGGIRVGGGSSLTIYAQSDDETTMGRLTAISNQPTSFLSAGAGIGGRNAFGSNINGQNAGTVIINGGLITAVGAGGAPGIGGGRGEQDGAPGTLTINGGILIAQGEPALSASGLTLPNSYRFWTNTEMENPYGDGTVYPDDTAFVNSDEYRFVRIETLEFIPPPEPCDDCGEYDCDGDCGDVPPPPNALQITPSPVNFGTIQQGSPNPGAISITITNTGDVELTLNTLPNVTGFTFGNLPNPVLQPGQSRTIAVNVNANLPVGTHNATATITTVEGASVDVELRFTVTAPQNSGNNNQTWNNNRPSGNVFTRPPATSSNNATANNNVQSPVEQTFTDVSPTDWFYAYVESAVENGLLNGVGNGEFAPNVATTRAMFVTVLWRLAGSPSMFGGTGFDDVSRYTWYSQAVSWANSYGIVSGVGNGEFVPNANITREQMGLILERYVGELVDEIMDRNYAPQNTATRAEMAAVMLRLADIH